MRLGAVLAVSLLAAATLVATPSDARADFASQCAAPDRTVSSSDPSIAVATGETVLVGASFTGGIDSLPAGGTLCVGPGATLSALYMNNAAGALVVAPGAGLVMPSVVVSAGFSLDVAGTAAFAGLGVNGAADVRIAAGAELTISSSFSPAGGAYVNDGTFTVQGDLTLNSSVSFDNAARLVVQGAGNLNGPLENSGLVTLSGGLTVNSSGSLTNECALDAGGPLMNNSTTSQNDGVVRIRGSFTNNGSWRQSHLGVVGAVELTDDGTVSGFGAYAFSGTTRVNGSFVGDSAAEPVRVDSVAPPSQIFDVENGTITNTVRTTLSVPDLTQECADQEPSTLADVAVSKVGPSASLQGGTITYGVRVTNAGPSDAHDVVLRDALPAGFTLDPASTSGTVVGGDLVWDVGLLASGAAASFTFSGQVGAPVGATLENVASSTSSTRDPDMSNNDGTAGASRVRTQVVGVVPPPNTAPTADDLELDTTTGRLAIGEVTATDPDLGQQLTFATTSLPAHGVVYLSATGGLLYVSRPDFAGIDTFTFEVCDNAVPTPACDTGSVTVNVRPRATDDVAQTFEATSVVVPVLSNDTRGAPLDPVVVTAPAHGTVVLSTDRATYTPAGGFVGTDTFEYRICSPSEPTFCDSALVTVTVVPRNDPPTVQPLLLVTTTGSGPVTGQLVVDDPDPSDTVTTQRGIPPRSGTNLVLPGGTTVYRPLGAFAGRDFYGVLACDDGAPQLCATARVVVEVSPVAAPDSAQTTQGTAVSVDVSTNDAGTVVEPALGTPPAHGAVTFTGDVARYVPDPAFVGTDTFTYTICAANAPDLCSTATVSVVVRTAAPSEPGPSEPGPSVPGPGPGPAPEGGGGLAATGGDPSAVLLLGLGLVLVGGGLLRASRRRA